MNYTWKLLGVAALAITLVIALPSLIKGRTTVTGVETVATITTPEVTNVSKNETALTKKSVKRLQINANRTIGIIGEIQNQGTEVSNQIKQLNAQSSEPIYIILDSPGGSVIAGAMVINAIETSKAPIYTICHQLCASMAAMIHQYGAKRYMFDRSIIMFHQAAASTQGSIGQMNAFIGVLTRYVNKMEADVAKRQGMTLLEYQTKTASELWLDSQEALASNVADELVDFDLSGLSSKQSAPSDKTTLPTYVETRLNDFKWSAFEFGNKVKIVDGIYEGQVGWFNGINADGTYSVLLVDPKNADIRLIVAVTPVQIIRVTK